jgi:hypothetical protein
LFAVRANVKSGVEAELARSKAALNPPIASRLIVNAPSSASGSRVPSSESQLDFSQAQQPAAQQQIKTGTPAEEDMVMFAYTQAVRANMRRHESALTLQSVKKVSKQHTQPRQGS